MKETNQSPLLGIFWAVAGPGEPEAGLLTLTCPLLEAEEYGDCLTLPDAHYDVWSRWRRDRLPPSTREIVHGSEYEEWPRGRVVFNCTTSQFHVYADRKIHLRQRLLDLILQQFHLTEAKVEFSLDAHYRSNRKLPA